MVIVVQFLLFLPLSPAVMEMASSYVALHVQGEVVGAAEGPFTQVALEGPVASVLAVVASQLVRPGKLPPATFPGAVVRLFARVCAQVGLEVRAFRVRLVASGMGAGVSHLTLATPSATPALLGLLAGRSLHGRLGEKEVHKLRGRRGSDDGVRDLVQANAAHHLGKKGRLVLGRRQLVAVVVLLHQELLVGRLLRLGVVCRLLLLLLGRHAGVHCKVGPAFQVLAVLRGGWRGDVAWEGGGKVMQVVGHLGGRDHRQSAREGIASRRLVLVLQHTALQGQRGRGAGHWRGGGHTGRCRRPHGRRDFRVVFNVGNVQEGGVEVRQRVGLLLDFVTALFRVQGIVRSVVQNEVQVQQVIVHLVRLEGTGGGAGAAGGAGGTVGGGGKERGGGRLPRHHVHHAALVGSVVRVEEVLHFLPALQRHT